MNTSINKKSKYPCTSCGKKIMFHQDAHKHPVLNTLQCSACHSVFKLVGDLTVYRKGSDLKGKDNYCRWCLDGGDLTLCADDNCQNGFCATCIQRNFGDDFLEWLGTQTDWHCFLCDYTQLNELRAKTLKAISTLKPRLMLIDRTTAEKQPVRETIISQIQETARQVVPEKLVPPVPETAILPVPEPARQVVPEKLVLPVPETTILPVPEKVVQPVPEAVVPPVSEKVVLPVSEAVVPSVPEMEVLPEPEAVVPPVPEIVVLPVSEAMVPSVPETEVLPEPEAVVPPVPETTIPPVPETTISPVPETAGLPVQETTQHKEKSFSEKPFTILETIQPKDKTTEEPKRKIDLQFRLFSRSKLCSTPAFKTVTREKTPPPKPEVVEQNPEREDKLGDLAKELEISDESDHDQDEYVEAKETNSDIMEVVEDIEEVEDVETDQVLEWALRDAEIIHKRIKILMDGINYSYKTFDLNSFRKDPSNFSTWLDLADSFLGGTPTVRDRVHDLQKFLTIND